LRRVRAACFEIGWLETSLPAVAVEAICAIDALLASGARPGSDAVRDQVRVFEAYVYRATIWMRTARQSG
ncbi:hypothetical protein, partial [Bradyrhizobium sp.]|uniref:hypothetical protein n=1 Tax=Bradyrhizobium sp. TaxID=376 RepID=UPI003BAE71EB